MNTNGQRFIIPVLETWESRSVTEGENGLELTREFYAIGTKNPLDGIPLGPQYGDRLSDDDRFQVTGRRIEPYSRGGGQNDALKITVTYTSNNDEVIDDPSKPGGNSGGGGDAVKSRVSVSIGSESVHLEKAIKQTSYPEGGVDFGDIIGQTERGIEGVDISAPILTFTEEHTLSQEAFTSRYLETLEDLAYTVNESTFRGFEPGTVRFEGASSEQSGSNWRLTYTFSVRRSEIVPVTIVDSEGATQLVQIPKAGWEYIWIKTIRSTSKDGADNEVEVHRISGAAVAQVYETTDFSFLGIGISPFTAPARINDGGAIDQSPGFDL